MSEEKEEIQPCPTQAGTGYGYIPEYKNRDGIWKRIDDEIVVCDNGQLSKLRAASYLDGIYEMMGCYGYEVAQAMCWIYVAMHRSPRNVRIVPCRLVYDVKVYKEADEAIEINELDLFHAEPRPESSADK